MKNMIRNIFAFIICSVLLLANVITANAADDPTVIYDGQNKEFTLMNATQKDLFKLYKGLIPGDTVEQKIVLNVKKIQAETSIYLRAECEEEVQIALDGTTMDVYQGNKCIVEDQLIFDDIKLGTYNKNGTEELTAVIQIPTSYGNEISDDEHLIHWIFTAQEDSDTPVTGDDVNICMQVSFIVIAVIIMIGVVRKKRGSSHFQ